MKDGFCHSDSKCTHPILHQNVTIGHDILGSRLTTEGGFDDDPCPSLSRTVDREIREGRQRIKAAILSRKIDLARFVKATM